MAKINQKHKTVGVSFSPQIRKSANLRARQLGVTFSRYISLCVEAEIAGKSPALGSVRLEDSTLWAEVDQLEQTIDERLHADVAALLQGAGIAFTQQVAAGGVNADFLISESPANACASEANGRTPLSCGGVTEADGGVTEADGRAATSCSDAQPAPATDVNTAKPLEAPRSGSALPGAATDSNSAKPRLGIAIECRYPSAAECAALLGKAILLQQVFARVLLCVPYLGVFEPELATVFARQGITVVTPDTLLEALHNAFKRPNE